MLVLSSDIIVFSKTWEEHLEHLEGVFQHLREAMLKLGASKCTLAVPEVSSLGNLMTRAIREIPMPQNVKKVVSFLGLASYYRRYAKGFAAITSPLHALTKKEVVFHWTPECHEAFTKLKHLLTMAPITAFPESNLPFRLYTDASTLGLAWCHLGTGARLERKDHLLCLLSSVVDREELSSHQAGMSVYCMGNCQAASLLDGEQVRHLYGPLHPAMA